MGEFEPCVREWIFTIGPPTRPTWLQDYVYKPELGWDAFLLAGFMAVLIALLTISYQALRAAWTKPVDMLKTE